MRTGDAGTPAACSDAAACSLVAEELERPAPLRCWIIGADGADSYTLASPVRLANHPSRPAGPVPSLGEHTSAVLDGLSTALAASDRGGDNGD